MSSENFKFAVIVQGLEGLSNATVISSQLHAGILSMMVY